MSSPLVLYKAILAYDGTYFAGFQKQANARTVQGEVETALVKLGWQQRSIQAAGRTDAGVHASGQVISFELRWRRDLPRLHQALNANLPADVAVQHLEIAPSDFRPRQDARARLYRYTILPHPVRNPVLERYGWRVWPAPDFNLLEQTATQVIGTHDFRAFGTPPHPGGPTIRHVFASKWKQELVGPHSTLCYVYEIEANAFLFHMVRRLVQLQKNIAQGMLPVDSITQYLNLQTPDPVTGLAPPHGLNLCAVRYADLEL
ncbi:MAG: tRNA pseudouridine(38-40) synthase TruA [Anaerolineales bacterium]|nr:tRNA pseudouridine(38-40) synthase TruA [Anaerolineales bacterium]